MRQLILIDPTDATRHVLARRLRARGVELEAVGDAAVGAELALASPPTVVVADLWMDGISGLQLCRLLRSEPATADVPIILRGDRDDPRSRFWAEHAGAFEFLARGRMGELVRAIAKATARPSGTDGFFQQLSGGSVGIRDRIAQHLDAALAESVISGEARGLATAGSFEELFDNLSQLVSRLTSHRWLALSVEDGSRVAVHTSPGRVARAIGEAREALGADDRGEVFSLEDDDASAHKEGPPPTVRDIAFGDRRLGRVALAAAPGARGHEQLVSLLARELGGPLRIAALIAEARRLATIDALTGLWNRRAFCEVMSKELARIERDRSALALMFLDVDRFKRINDEHGHDTGDRVLSALGPTLKRSLRLADLASRWGGEEFVVAMPSTTSMDALVAAERVREAVEALEVLDEEGRRVCVTISIGLAQARRGDSLEALCRRADAAMYAAKTSGRNRVVVDASAEGEPPAGGRLAA